MTLAERIFGQQKPSDEGTALSDQTYVSPLWECYEPEDDGERCPECHGSGELRAWGEPNPEDGMPCPECGGDGWIYREDDEF
jgi:DnaJ-class molecular chaperone